MKSSNGSMGGRAEDLCLECGFCCNGVIFADIKLRPADHPARLKALAEPFMQPQPGQTAKISWHGSRLTQPCLFFDGSRCRVYEQRPGHCRNFECLLLSNVMAKRLPRQAALRIIQTARQQADTVRNLLQVLGDTDEQESLANRFRRTSRRLEQVGAETEMAETYSDLTLAVHDLNCLLSEAFYPG
ncbi:MAG TPA: YkgJ family cysteine cluster protein [Clostridia bacterium]|nr:YkgJ family cysteine cluster protein [Clostridia bacterium]